MIYFGTKNDDVVIDTLGGDDFFYGGSGWDSFGSYSGDDILFMGRGDDAVYVYNRPSDLIVFGGRGFDSLLIDADDATVVTKGKASYVTTETGLTIRAQGFEEILWDLW